MKNEGQQLKDVHKKTDSKDLSNGEGKKKKKPRSRNRPRNKANRLKAQAIATQDCQHLSEIQTSNMDVKTEQILGKEPAIVTHDQTVTEREAKELINQEVTEPKVESVEVLLRGGGGEKTREQIKAEREAKKLAKQAAKTNKSAPNSSLDKSVPAKVTQHTVPDAPSICTVKTTRPEIADPSKNIPEKKPPMSKAERRAIQEAQRAAKAQKQSGTNQCATTSGGTRTTPSKAGAAATSLMACAVPKTSPTLDKVRNGKTKDCEVKLFNHLEHASKEATLFVNHLQLHPAIVRLGEQYAKRTIVGSNARCLAFLHALRTLIQDFETPPKRELARSLETTIQYCTQYLHRCRPLAVSVTNAHKHIKHVLMQLPVDKPESELKENLCHFIDTYIENQIGKAAQAISSSMQEKICDGDVLLTFGCSSLINYIFEEAHSRQVKFRVIVVDSRPFYEGQELLRRLTTHEIPCSYVLINAVGFVMPETTKVVLGAHALLANGYVMARTGTAQVALVAHSLNVPVLVCCETHKFSERFQTDAIVYNELGNPDELILDENLSNWQSKSKMSPLNLNYDITPPELVTAVVTEVSILPCTSVPVILRIKPTEIGYFS